MKINPKLSFTINNKNYTHHEANEWEYRRLVRTYKYLKKHHNVKFDAQIKTFLKNKDVTSLNDAILQAKLHLGIEKIKKMEKARVSLGDTFAKIATRLSFGKRKFSVTYITIPTNLSAKQLLTKIENIMLINNEKHLAMNLGACPDHYVLQATKPRVQEVLEITGGSPLPIHFYCNYGDTTDLKSKLTPGYTEQAVGTAELSGNFIMGGVRHQVKETENGLIFKALVEFPAMMPNFMIHDHQKHLACEFGHWITNALSINEKTTNY